MNPNFTAKISLTLAFYLSISLIQSTHAKKQPEIWYQSIWCLQQSGEMEVKLQDNSRIDCLTKTHATEIEFAHKWQEAIGQSLHYALLSKKKAGIGLIIESAEEVHHWYALKQTVDAFNLPISLWKIENDN